MFDEKTVKGMIEGIIELNETLGPFGLIIPALFAAGVIGLLLYCYKKPGTKSSRALMGTLAVIYLYSGWTIYYGKDAMGASLAWVGAIALWTVALFLVLDAIYGWTHVRWPQRLDLKVLSVALMITGIFVYPIVEVALGFTWPGMVLFGAECPTTIFLIGLFIGSIPKVNKPLFVLASLNAVFTGTSVALNGAAFDWLYSAAGFLGIFMILRDFQGIFLKRDK